MNGEARHSHDIGVVGEQIAAEFLSSKDYAVIARNYHAGHAEIDIIAISPDAETVAFCEVKTRAESVAEKYGRPASAVGKTKQRFLILAAQDYIKKHQDKCAGRRVRIDVIEVYIPARGAAKVRHMQNAVIAKDGYNR